MVERAPTAMPGAPLAAATAAASPTLATRLSGQLRAAIMSGAFAPGSKLVLDRIRADLGVSLSPLREALCRLESEGLVRAEDQRGYRVAPVSAENLDEVIRLRVELEGMAVAEAVRRGDEAWEGRILAALHQLRRCPPSPPSAPRTREAQETWEARHRALHAEFISACGMPLLRQFCATLHDQSDRYRRLFLREHGPDRDVPAEHAAIAAALIERRGDDAVALLRAHVERTGRNVREALTVRT